jgi:hypothetical protein
MALKDGEKIAIQEWLRRRAQPIPCGARNGLGGVDDLDRKRRHGISLSICLGQIR